MKVLQVEIRLQDLWALVLLSAGEVACVRLYPSREAAQRAGEEITAQHPELTQTVCMVSNPLVVSVAPSGEGASVPATCR